MNASQKEFNYHIVLVEPQIQGNIGAIARLCNNYQTKELVLVNPKADYLGEEARIRAKHSIQHKGNFF